MSLPDDLLKQAKKLATMEKKRPQQASLRRAVSTAYYALFHLLCEDGAKRISPNTPVRLSHAIRRSITHGDMKSAAKGINQPTPPRQYTGLLSATPSQDLLDVASHFVNLQEARHSADYDLSIRFSRVNALTKVQEAEDAFKKWKLVRSTDDANVFLSATFFWKNFNTR